MVQVYAALFSLALTHKLVVRAFGNPDNFGKKPLLLPPTHSFKHVPCAHNRIWIALFGKRYPLQKFPAHHGKHLVFHWPLQGHAHKCFRLKIPWQKGKDPRRVLCRKLHKNYCSRLRSLTPQPVRQPRQRLLVCCTL